MEKYRQFADASKGINPFTPHWSQAKSSIVEKITKGVVLLIPFILKLILFIISFLYLFLVDLIIY